MLGCSPISAQMPFTSLVLLLEVQRDVAQAFLDMIHLSQGSEDSWGNTCEENWRPHGARECKLDCEQVGEQGWVPKGQE
jgi:hypothetical protein